MQKRRDTRACSGDENAFADKPRRERGVHGGSAMATALMDAHDDGLEF